MRISETYGAQALKGNSPTSGLFKFLVARGGIEPGPRMTDPNLIISRGIELKTPSHLCAHQNFRKCHESSPPNQFA